MSNRNFDSRVVIQRLRDKNMAQNFAQFQQNSQSIINNPQTSDPSPQRIGQYYDGAGTAVVQNLLGGGYTVNLGATANLIPSAPSVPPAPPVTVPDAPTDVIATGDNGQAVITFTPPTNDGGATITSYTVTSSPGGITETASSSPITIIGLRNDETYTFTVIATNSVGDSVPSTASNSVTPSNPSSSAPTITIVYPTTNSIIVNFMTPSSFGTISNYEYSTDGGATFTALSPADTTSPITIPSLSPTTAYNIAIRAINNVPATGDRSNIVPVTTATT